MTIKYLGHSCFYLADSAGVSVVTDPYGAVGFGMPAVSADVVTVSHSHYDHCNVSAVRGGPTVLSSAGSFRVKNVGFEAVLSYHDDAHGAKRGQNLIFKIFMDGVTVCHLGDLGERPSESLLQKIGHADVLLIPVGGNYTIGAEDAAAYVEALSPAVAIPMHYRVPGLTVDVGGPEPFLSLVKGEVLRASEVEVSRDSLKGNKKIIVMDRSQAWT